MPPPAAVIVSDAHIGPEVPAAPFLRFLAAVPDLGRQLVINGDLFEFWFEYRTVVPQRAFPVLAALRDLVTRGIAVTVTGGNHDRWGGRFWPEQLGAAFHPEQVRLDLAGMDAVVRHGDGIHETDRSSRVLHRMTRWRVTTAGFRWLHPDIGLRLVDVLSRALARRDRDPAAIARGAEAQSAWAGAYLAAHPDVQLLVLGHTHRPAVEPAGPGRWYLNPGAWCEGQRYAVVTADGPELRRFPAG